MLMHGSNTSSLSDVSILERLDGVRGIAIDRPGIGLSDPLNLPPERYREAVVRCVEGVLDALGLAETALVGGSMGAHLGPVVRPGAPRAHPAPRAARRGAPCYRAPASRPPCG